MAGKQRPTIVYAGVALALAFWLIETFLHYWIFDSGAALEWWPHDKNELWMRCLIFILLVTFSFYAQYVASKKIKIEQEKFSTFKATMNTVMDIEGNFLNNLSLYTLEIEDSHTLSKQSMQEIQDLIRNTHQRLNVLATAREIEEEIVAGSIPVVRVNNSSE